MDFNKKVFKNKTFSSFLGEIYDKSIEREKKLDNLIEDLSPMIKNIGDATILVPLIAQYLGLSIKTNEHLIKMADIIQKALSTGGRGDNNGNIESKLTDKEKKDLQDVYKEMTNSKK